MRHRLASTFSVILLAHALVPLNVFTQEQHTRPRRAVVTQSQSAREADDELPRLKEEPTIRIGLTTDANSVAISTDAERLNLILAREAPTQLEVARVRIEPRVRNPLPEADTSPRLPANATKSVQVATRDAKSKSASNNNARPQPAPAGVKLASRANAPTRAAVVYAASAGQLLEARAPLTFESDGDSSLLRFNDKPYRGQLEVFVNMKGALTVVNVVGLEDYVRGVVPNELSPGAFPEMEALKAQAVAARTYAVANMGRFESQGFDLLPTTRSQVYGGRSTEHPLTDRAVAETRGRVATFDGRPIDALYTSTCGGHTEDAENIFGHDAVPYLRATACAADFEDTFDHSKLRTSRDVPNLRDAAHASSPRDAALLQVHGFKLSTRLSDEWLAAPVTTEELRAIISNVAALSRQPAPTVTNESVRPGGFAAALYLALDGESRGRVLLKKADVEYILGFRDADDIPEANRYDLAQLIRDEHISLYPDATIRPRQPLTRSRVIGAVRGALEARGLLKLQKATARSAKDGTLVVRAGPKNAERTLNVLSSAFLFRAYGEVFSPTEELTIAGGEPVAFHVGTDGQVDYLEARLAPNGAAADRFSVYSNWFVSMTPAEAAARLARHAGNTGALNDLRVRARGASGRVIDLEVEGARATAHVRGGTIRTALGLREQIFVIERTFDEAGRVALYTFRGRGWGHGVGMCQVGAYGMARAGLDYEKILKTFYTGISLKRMY